MTNAFCCGPFQYKGETHRMVQMCHVLGSKEDWYSLGSIDNDKCPNDPGRYMNEVLTRMFGKEYLTMKARKFDSPGHANKHWSNDQRLVSLWVDAWEKGKNTTLNRIKYRGDVRFTRIQPWTSIAAATTLVEQRTDAHFAFAKPYEGEAWKSILAVAKQIHHESIVSEVQ